MPAYKNPLYIQASLYLKGAYAETMSSGELQELENSLLTGLDNQISIMTELIGSVFEQSTALYKKMNLEEKKLTAKNVLHPITDHHYLALSKRYLALMLLITRLARANCRLIRTKYKITSKMNTRDELHHFALDHSPPPSSPLKTLLPPFIGSFKKTKFFYSKLFRETMDLTDSQWDAVKDLVPQKLNQGAGRPPQVTRDVLNGILWKLRTAASWNDLPREYPSHQTCYRYYTQWTRSGHLNNVVNALVKHLKENGFDLYEYMKNGEIELFEMAKHTHIRFAPRLQDTWQSSTALLLIQILIMKLRKQGKPAKTIDQVFPLTEE